MFLVSKKLCVVILVIPVLLLAACGGDRQALEGRTADGPKEHKAETRSDESAAAAGGTERDARDGAARAGNAAGGARSGKVTLEISGDPGTGFSGTCAVGEEKRELDGQVPERFIYELDGRRLRCEIQTEEADGAALTVLTAGNAHYIQQSGTRGATMSFVYSERGFSSSTVSSAGATSTSSSSSSVSSYSSSETDR
jgi:hypothetical protein